MALKLLLKKNIIKLLFFFILVNYQHVSHKARLVLIWIEIQEKSSIQNTQSQNKSLMNTLYFPSYPLIPPTSIICHDFTISLIFLINCQFSTCKNTPKPQRNFQKFSPNSHALLTVLWQFVGDFFYRIQYLQIIPKLALKRIWIHRLSRVRTTVSFFSIVYSNIFSKSFTVELKIQIWTDFEAYTTCG